MRALGDAPYKLLALDLDGTTISPDGSVRPATIAAIRRALDAGLLIAFATGRNYSESKPILDQIGHWPTSVFVGGAVVVDTDSGAVAHRTGMDAVLSTELVAAVKELGHAALCLQEGPGLPDYLVAGEPPEAFRYWVTTKGVAWDRFAGDTPAQHQHTIRIGVLADLAEAGRIEAALTERFGERVYLHNIEVPGTLNVVEIFDPSVNKWEGIKHIAARHGITPAKIIAVGDDRNDLHMIRHAGLGVAMGNAKDEVKQLADRVIGPNEQDGLAAFIHELVDGTVSSATQAAAQGPAADAPDGPAARTAP